MTQHLTPQQQLAYSPGPGHFIHKDAFTLAEDTFLGVDPRYSDIPQLRREYVQSELVYRISSASAVLLTAGVALSVTLQLDWWTAVLLVLTVVSGVGSAHLRGNTLVRRDKWLHAQNLAVTRCEQAVAAELETPTPAPQVVTKLRKAPPTAQAHADYAVFDRITQVTKRVGGCLAHPDTPPDSYSALYDNLDAAKSLHKAYKTAVELDHQRGREVVVKCVSRIEHTLDAFEKMVETKTEQYVPDDDIHYRTADGHTILVVKGTESS